MSHPRHPSCFNGLNNARLRVISSHRLLSLLMRCRCTINKMMCTYKLWLHRKDSNSVILKTNNLSCGKSRFHWTWNNKRNICTSSIHFRVRVSYAYVVDATRQRSHVICSNVIDSEQRKISLTCELKPSDKKYIPGDSCANEKHRTSWHQAECSPARLVLFRVACGHRLVLGAQQWHTVTCPVLPPCGSHPGIVKRICFIYIWEEYPPPPHNTHIGTDYVNG
jgi:hypothetical protein